MAQHRAQARAARTAYVGQHRAARTPRVVLVVRALLLMLGLGALAIVVSACTAAAPAQQTPAPVQAPAPAVVVATATATVGTHTATATATATAVPAPAVVPCTEEDGSAPGQSFPCHWAGGPNGLGRTYTLTEPVCSVYQVALAESQYAQGDPVDVDCDDLESQTGAF
jgi:hypothetical protein